MKFLVGKPGLDGHSNGAEQIAVRARDAGMEVVYEGIRLTPAEIVNAALEEGVHCVGLSILSGSHVPLVRDVMERMRAEGLDDVPVVVGGIIPPEDEALLKAAGVAAVYTPKDFDLNAIMRDIVRIVEDAGESGGLIIIGRRPEVVEASGIEESLLHRRTRMAYGRRESAREGSTRASSRSAMRKSRCSAWSRASPNSCRFPRPRICASCRPSSAGATPAPPSRPPCSSRRWRR